jgi:mRNA-degrading endonuclease RelE of RelBE toxin-antitoxin system
VRGEGARVALSARFKRDLRKVDPRIRGAAQKALLQLVRNRSHPGLNLERIEGEIWSIRVTRNFRIFLRRTSDDEGELFLASRLENHDIYKRR